MPALSRSLGRLPETILPRGELATAETRRAMSTGVLTPRQPASSSLGVCVAPFLAIAHAGPPGMVFPSSLTRIRLVAGALAAPGLPEISCAALSRTGDSIPTEKPETKASLAFCTGKEAERGSSAPGNPAGLLATTASPPIIFPDAPVESCTGAKAFSEAAAPAELFSPVPGVLSRGCQRARSTWSSTLRAALPETRSRSDR